MCLIFQIEHLKNLLLKSVSIDIYDNKYEYKSGSKANRVGIALKIIQKLSAC